MHGGGNLDTVGGRLLIDLKQNGWLAVFIDSCPLRNSPGNHLANVTVKLSNGLSAVQNTKLDRIVSNVPAKVGKELWSIMLFDAWQNLTPGGDIWFVSINGLRDYFKRTFKEQFGNYDKIKQGQDYTVHRAVKE
ncbi:MAG: hypothetical protein B7Z82_05745 [Halothiobacillus sp. 20-54-6]|nr:MAG: hypothetical protein B7Z82_05745 [Halothiobacillus sp. 20-54-6]